MKFLSKEERAKLSNEEQAALDEEIFLGIKKLQKDCLYSMTEEELQKLHEDFLGELNSKEEETLSLKKRITEVEIIREKKRELALKLDALAQMQASFSV